MARWRQKQEFPICPDIHGYSKILPHRYPFLLIDKVVEMDYSNMRVVAIKNVTCNEEFFSGHFPQEPIMPGVLQIEAMAQAGGVLLLSPKGIGGNMPISREDNAKIRRMVVPGDQLVIETKITKLRKKAGKVESVIRVDGQVQAKRLYFSQLQMKLRLREIDVEISQEQVKMVSASSINKWNFPNIL